MLMLYFQYFHKPDCNESEDYMVSANTPKKPATAAKRPTARKTAASGSGPKTASPQSATRSQPKRTGSRRQRYTDKITEVPTWLSAVVSVVGVGVAIGAGLYATRRQWMSQAQDWRDNFSAAFADDETDNDNFDQTRHAGRDSMRDDPGDDWEDIDDMSDASFPASDPPSFNPGTA